MTKCDANDKHLWLRDNVFYYFAELPRVNGKRRYLRQSLKTSNYYEALERIKGLNNPAANDFVKSHTAPAQIRITPIKHKISEIIESMLLKANNCKHEAVRKRNTILRLLKDVGIGLNDDYAKFHTIETVESITKNIMAESRLKGDGRQRYLGYIKSLATCGSILYPDDYKLNVIAQLPKLDGTKKSEREPHLPYTNEQLLEIFNPAHDFFKNNPDAFFICLITTI